MDSRHLTRYSGWAQEWCAYSTIFHAVSKPSPGAVRKAWLIEWAESSQVMRINILKKVARVESVQKEEKKTSVSHSKYDLKKLVDRPPFEYVSTLPSPAQPSPAPAFSANTHVGSQNVREGVRVSKWVRKLKVLHAHSRRGKWRYWFEEHPLVSEQYAAIVCHQGLPGVCVFGPGCLVASW